MEVPSLLEKGSIGGKGDILKPKPENPVAPPPPPVGGCCV
ncbi:hypothetical protein Gorai_020151 [Gossypium raimondii]|nr:hypothetical protein [Gossypium raimondii]